MSLYRRGICLRWAKLRGHPDLCDKTGEQGEHGKDAAGSPVVRWVEQLRWPLQAVRLVGQPHRSRTKIPPVHGACTQMILDMMKGCRGLTDVREPTVLAGEP